MNCRHLPHELPSCTSQITWRKTAMLKSPRFLRRKDAKRRHLEDTGIVHAIKARWCIDIKYGVKMEAIALVQDWIQSVGSIAGLSRENTSLLSGAIGASESRLELEVEFESLAKLEGFWGAIPPVEHKAWSQRARNFIIDGSPRWEVYRTCPIFAEKAETDPVTATLKAWESAEAVKSPPTELPPSILDEYLRKPLKESPDAESPLQLPPGDQSGRRIATDWKGDPMIINPGDNMPLF